LAADQGIRVDDEMSFEDRCDEISDCLEEEDFEYARSEIRELIEGFPDRAEPLFLMGTCLAMEGKGREAVAFLERAITIDPCPEAYYNLAGAQRSLFRLKETVISLKKVVELDGRKGDYGKKAKADLEDLAAMIQKDSGITLDQYLDNRARFDEAFQHLTHGRYQEAIRDFDQVLEVESDHVQSFGNLGLAYAGLGDRENAIRHFDKAIELDPEYQPAIDNREIVMELAPGERLNPKAVREIEFYAEKASKEEKSEAGTSEGLSAGLVRSSGTSLGRRLKKILWK